MAYSDALTELNDSLADYFGIAVDYATVAGVSTTGITAVVDFLEAEGQAMCDMPTASISSPEIGALVTIDSDSSTWRVYDYGNVRRGYTELDIRSTDYWKTGTLQSQSGATWSGAATHPIYIDPNGTTEFIDGDTHNVETVYSARAPYDATITEKKRLVIGGSNYYIQGVTIDATGSRYMDLDLSLRSF